MALAWQSPVYLERKRLLERLPEEPGFAIHLEAPAGFGKSVLAGQLAAQLGLRTLWASGLLGEPRSLLAKALDLPEEVPWGGVVEALRAEVVLEDLTGTEDLSPLLRTLPCLLVLASRKPLPYPELPNPHGKPSRAHGPHPGPEGEPIPGGVPRRPSPGCFASSASCPCPAGNGKPLPKRASKAPI